jgi:hypothetical protein
MSTWQQTVITQHTTLATQVVATHWPGRRSAIAYNKKRKVIRLRKLYSLGENVMAGADLDGGATPVQAACVIDTGSQGGWRRTGGGGCMSQSPPDRLGGCCLMPLSDS